MNTTSFEITPIVSSMDMDSLTTLIDNVTTPAPVKVPGSYYLTIRDIYFVFNGIIVCSGFLFNTIALLVFISSSTLRHTTTAHYLIALSIADSTYLSGDLFRWLASKSHSFEEVVKDTDVINQHDVLCKLMYVIRYAAMVCSSWITVAITTERFLTIKFPLRIGRISTPRIAKIAIFSITVFSISMCIFTVWCLKVYPVSQTGHDACQLDLDKLNLFKTMYWVSIRAMTLIVPSVIVTILTICIICLLKQRGKTQSQLQASTTSKAAEKRNALERQLTIMLVAVAITFVILRLPYTVIWEINQYKKTIWQPLDPWLSYRIYVAYRLTDLLAMSNYAINFFLYFMCGSTFRNKLKKLCCCVRFRAKPQSLSLSLDTDTSAVSRTTSVTGGTKISNSTQPVENDTRL